MDLPLNAVVSVDAMATLQALQKPHATFGELARQVFDLITKSMVGPASRVDCVIDQYREVSIKGSKRLQRAHAHGTMRVQILSASQKVPVQWKRFLSNNSNKTDLLAL